MAKKNNTKKTASRSPKKRAEVNPEVIENDYDLETIEEIDGNKDPRTITFRILDRSINKIVTRCELVERLAPEYLDALGIDIEE